ncbi:MAG: hypothetical protein DWQ02_04740 [Bacteroidetes bacterium]|nr:MAG: hypothetical protein DWQ02_04740 [Bacteroidota bacterium]
MSKKSIVVMMLLTLLTTGLFARISHDSTKFKGVYIHDLNYQGNNYGVFVFERDVFDLLDIIERNFILNGIPILRDYSAYSCAYLQCVVYHDIEENELGIELYDCRPELVLRLSSPSYIRFPIGTTEIPKKRPPMQSALKKALQNSEAFTILFDLESGNDGTVASEVKTTPDEKVEADNIEAYLYPLEGEYELLSLEFPETLLVIKKAGEGYTIFKKVKGPGSDTEVLCDFLPEKEGSAYEGYWNLDTSRQLAVRLKFKKNGNLTLYFNDHFDRKIKFEKVKNHNSPQPF